MKEKFFCKCCNKWNEPSEKDGVRGMKVSLTEDYYKKYNLYEELHFPKRYRYEAYRPSHEEIIATKENRASVYQTLHLAGFI
jgi:hypothetical protein